MTSEEIRKKISQKIGRPTNVRAGTEYEHVIWFRLRPSQMLCLVKKTGEVIWEEDLPDELAPEGEGKWYILPPED